MTLLQILPVLAYAAAVAIILAIALGKTASPSVRGAMLLGLAVAFAGFSALTVAGDGVLGFWTNHTTNLAGNQVWFDLLIAVGISFYVMAPRARAVGMALLPWAVAVVATASVALVPMLARLIWLERKAAASTDRASV